MASLQIRMLGEFSISAGDVQISNSENRSHKIWSLLAYFVYHRSRMIPPAELSKVFWKDSNCGNASSGALKTALHRLRTALDRLWPNAGHQLILNHNGGYIWNPDVTISLDIEEFERLCLTEATREEERLEQLMTALHMYRGKFLARQSSELWTISVSAYYHTLYLNALAEVLPLLFERGKQQEVIDLCCFASTIEPYNEMIHCFWMRALLGLGDQKSAAELYQEFSAQLYTKFSILPGEEIRGLYREATRLTNETKITMEILMDQLEEKNPSSGALICDYDFFVVLCRSMARAMFRTGMATHVVLLTVEAEDSAPLPGRSLIRAMDNLEEQIRTNLRRGDSAARCSTSQFVLLLPQANYENSEMVSNRIIKAFVRQYPHSPARIYYKIHPLMPG